MGMVACFASIDTATAAGLKADPARMDAFLYPEGDGEPPHCIDIDKAWHCIHFMLAGTADVAGQPAALAVLGGEEAGDDLGYGPARILDAVGVARVADELASLDETHFRARFDPRAMQATHVYLSDMCVRDGEEALDYLAHHYRQLAAFYAGASARGDAVVLWLC